jgi:hypothetical protein
MKTPNTKIQTPTKSQTSNLKLHLVRTANHIAGWYWEVEGLLVFGVWKPVFRCR